MDQKTQIIHVFDQCAEEYQDKFMDVDLYNETYDLFCECIPKKHAKILELGCGPGNITRYLLQKRADFQILGTDLASKMLTLAKANNPSADFQALDCREILTLEKKFDAIMCGFCLPYLSKEETFALIKDAAQALNKGGIFYISTMEDDYSKSGLKKSSSGEYEMHIYYHQADYLSNAFRESGFEILDLRRIDFRQPSGEITQDLVVIGRKKEN